MRGVLRLAVAVILIFGCSQAEVQSYKGYKLLRIRTSDIGWLEKLEEDVADRSLKDEPQRPQLDVWAEPNAYRKHADVMVAPEFLQTFLLLLKEQGIEKIDIVKRDVQRGIDRQKRELDSTKSLRSKRDAAERENIEDYNLATYHRYHEIVDHMQNLAREYPELVEVINITKTFEGRDLLGVKIGRAKPFKPAIFIDAGIHAREWIAPAAALFVANKLVTRYGRDSDITKMVDKFDWFIVPSANPDGYEYSMTADRLWRKTRSKNVTVSKWCYGVDANRNWGYRWGEVGVSRNPCTSVYAGPSPFSEVEVAGIRDFTTWKIPDLKVYVSLHSYGQVVLSPWGYTSKKPENYDDQHSAARVAVEAIRNKTGAEYKYGSITELMYPASGTSIDYMLSKSVPYTYGIELRPEDIEYGFGFDIPVRYIEPTGEEMLSAFLTMAKYATETQKL